MSVGWNLIQIVDRISLEGFPAEIRLSVKYGDIIEGTVCRQQILVVEMKSRHRDKPEWPWTVATEEVVPDYIEDFTSAELQRKDYLTWIRGLVRRVLTHELDEQFKFNGNRVFDVPHTEEAAR